MTVVPPSPGSSSSREVLGRCVPGSTPDDNVRSTASRGVTSIEVGVYGAVASGRARPSGKRAGDGRPLNGRLENRRGVDALGGRNLRACVPGFASPTDESIP